MNLRHMPQLGKHLERKFKLTVGDSFVSFMEFPQRFKTFARVLSFPPTLNWFTKCEQQISQNGRRRRLQPFLVQSPTFLSSRLFAVCPKLQPGLCVNMYFVDSKSKCVHFLSFAFPTSPSQFDENGLFQQENLRASRPEGNQRTKRGT